MILHRTSNQKRRASFTFLKNQKQQIALLSKLDKKNWIDEIFNRSLPIPKEYSSRFGPPGLMKNVFYGSERRQTTFFEYGYRLLKTQSVIGRGVAAMCFEIRYQGKRKPIDVSNAGNRKDILDPKSYLAAQSWLLGQDSMPRRD